MEIYRSCLQRSSSWAIIYLDIDIMRDDSAKTAEGLCFKGETSSGDKEGGAGLTYWQPKSRNEDVNRGLAVI